MEIAECDLQACVLGVVLEVQKHQDSP